jgi:5'-nucleotidase/UDP-sugar diphosphatase
LIERIRSAGQPVLIVDSGRLFDEAGVSTVSGQMIKKARLISRIYRHMNVDAVNITEQELIYGLPFLRKEASQGLSLISANLMDSRKGVPLFKSYVIRKVDNVRVAFFGLLSPDRSASIREAMGKNILIQDPVETAQKMIKILRNRADVIILLSDLGLEKEKELINKVPGIHFILGGREGRYCDSAMKENNTRIFQSYIKGMYAGKLQLTIAGGSSPFEEGQGSGNRFQWGLMPLDTTIPEDKTISEWIQRDGFK